MTRTERNVVKPLEVPAWQTEEIGAPAQPEVDAAANSSAARLSIEDFLSLSSRPRTAGPSPEKASSAPTRVGSAEALDGCPHCGARLSSIDLKFNRCLSCGKPPVQMAAENSSVNNSTWTVRI
jgi:hypothetical protein